MPARRSLLAAPLLLLVRHARAEEAGAWPTRSVRLVVPGPAGGAGDAVSRIVADGMGRALGQAVVIENRPGAGTNIGMAVVARAAPDGYTLGMPSAASHAVNRWMYRSLPFDPVADFAPITLMALVPNIMVIAPSVPATTVAEFVAYCRAMGTPPVYGSVGAGSSQHLAGVQFSLATGIPMEHAPYNNSGQMNADLIAGRLAVLFQSVSGTERLPAFPSVPTLPELGYDITSMGWFGLDAPAGTPEPILERAHAAAMTSLHEPAVVARLIGSGAVPRPMTRAEFTAFQAAETAKMRDLVRASGAMVD